MVKVREYNIHKALSHPRVVALFDIFEIDSGSFATILEIAAGGDLAWHLQQHKVCRCIATLDAVFLP